jgi:uncharacterized membrane protein
VKQTIILFLLASSIALMGLTQSEKIPLMGDELVNYYIGSLSELSNVYKGLSLGADSHGPLYHTLNWAWTQLGQLWGINSEQWLRLPSTLFLIIGLIFLSTVLKKNLPISLVLVLILSLFTWETLRIHLSENRSYGWVMFLVCLEILICNRYYNNKKLVWLILMCLTMSASILSHPMATLYNGATVAGLIIALKIKKKESVLDYKPLLATMVGSLALLPWMVSYWGQIESTLSTSVKWSSPPTLFQLFEFSRPNTGLLLLGIVWILLFLNSKKPINSLKEMNHLWTTIGILYLFLTFGLWVISQYSNPLFLERYVLPNQVGLTLLLAGLFQGFIPNPWNTKYSVILYITCVLLIFHVFKLEPPTRESTGGFSNKENPWVDAGFADEQYFTKNIPIICESSTTYLPRRYYHSGNQDYILVLEEDVAKKAKGVWLMDYNMNQALKSVDSKHNVMSWEEILKNHNSFYLLNEATAPQDSKLDPKKYRRTLLNPPNNGNLKVELVEKIIPKEQSCKLLD